MLEDLLLGLLHSAPDSPGMVREQLKALKWKESEKYYILAMDFGRVRPKADLTAMAGRLRTLVGVPLLIVGSHFVAVIGCGQADDIHDKDFPGLLPFLREHDLQAGLSNGFYDLLAMHRHFRQSLKCIELVVHYERTHHFYRYEDYLISHMLELCATQTDIQDFCHPLAVRIHRHDREHGTDYIRTLYAYLRLGRSIQLAADALHVHRNTMYHRISRLKELFGVDFDDLGLVLKLLMSMQVYAYTRVFDVKIWG
jgi:Regulator of polyketide synthase expression